MVIYEFGVQDLARTHFAISPLFELTQSLRALVEPSRSAFHLPWIEGLRDGRLSGLDLLPAIELVPPRGSTPDFIAPPPSTPLGEIGDDLASCGAPPRRACARRSASASAGGEHR